MLGTQTFAEKVQIYVIKPENVYMHRCTTRVAGDRVSAHRRRNSLWRVAGGQRRVLCWVEIWEVVSSQHQKHPFILETPKALFHLKDKNCPESRCEGHAGMQHQLRLRPSNQNFLILLQRWQPASHPSSIHPTSFSIGQQHQSRNFFSLFSRYIDVFRLPWVLYPLARDGEPCLFKWAEVNQNTGVGFKQGLISLHRFGSWALTCSILKGSHCAAFIGLSASLSAALYSLNLADCTTTSRCKSYTFTVPPTLFTHRQWE